jgi:hypothetical protein
MGVSWDWASLSASGGPVAWDFQQLVSEAPPTEDGFAEMLARPRENKALRWVTIQPPPRSSDIEHINEEQLLSRSSELVQFVGRWVDIDARMQLGVVNNLLGRNTLLGGRAFDRMGRFQVEIGPLSPRAWRRLMQDGDLYPLAREIVSLFVRDPLEYTFELFLAESVAHTFTLSTGWSSKLGRDTWLGTNHQNRLTVPGAV